MIVDIIVGVILLVSIGVSLMRGFIREVLSIIGILGGIGAAYAGGPILNIYMQDWLGIEEGEETPKLFDILPYDILSVILSYSIIFIIVVIILSIVSHFLSESARALGLGPLDRTLGMVFGFLRAMLVLGCVYLAFNALAPDDIEEEWTEGSFSIGYIAKAGNIVADIFPFELWDNTDTEEKESDISVRETLERADVLKKEDENSSSDKDPETTEKETQGYERGFRNEMDKLFQMQNPQNFNE